MTHQGVVLKKGKEKVVFQKHHWIFSGAIESFPPFANGDILPIFSAEKQLLGHGYFNRSSALCGRIISFGTQNPYEAIVEHLKQAIALRKTLFRGQTNAYRLINGEGDLLPGLIVDQYADYLVLQIGTLGMEKLKSQIVTHLSSLLNIRGIYEKSLLPTRKEEGLSPCEGNLFGEEADVVEIHENQCRYLISYKKGQKTGFFLDQREMRSLIGELAYQKKVLNCFSYTGGFSVSALKQGATSVDSVDLSQEALDLAIQNLALNGYSSKDNRLICKDVLHFLRESSSLDYEVVILDPPAFAKKKKDVIQACKGYKEINRQAMQKMPERSYLLTCSCSYHVDEVLFQQVVFQAALEAKRSVKILSKHRLALDHPVNLYHPEGSYLKSLLLWID